MKKYSVIALFLMKCCCSGPIYSQDLKLRDEAVSWNNAAVNELVKVNKVMNGIRQRTLKAFTKFQQVEAQMSLEDKEVWAITKIKFSSNFIDGAAYQTDTRNKVVRTNKYMEAARITTSGAEMDAYHKYAIDYAKSAMTVSKQSLDCEAPIEMYLKVLESILSKY